MSFSSGPGAAAPAELPEAVLNHRLRRVDWRFLLPLPRVQRAVCYPAGDLREGVALIAERLVPSESATEAECDLAVVVDPDEAELRAARAALRPGGICYAEWTRTGAMSPRRLRARLQSAGFECVRFYLPWRSLTRPVAWIPLESAACQAVFPASPSHPEPAPPAAGAASAKPLHAGRRCGSRSPTIRSGAEAG